MDEFLNDPLNPFDRFLASPNLDMLNSALPYVGESIRKPLALYIKMSEIHRIVEDMDNEEVLSACGFEYNNPNIEAVLRAMKAAGGKNAGPQIDSMLNMLEMFHLYQSFTEMMQKNPELFNLINNMMGQKDNPSTSSDNLAKILPFLMSQSGQNTSSDNSDMFNVLSEFLKKQEL